MKMKKLISIALILTMTFSMAACGERDSTGDTAASTDATVTEEVGEDVPTEPEDVVTDEEVASITEESPEDLAA